MDRSRPEWSPFNEHVREGNIEAPEVIGKHAVGRRNAEREKNGRGVQDV